MSASCEYLNELGFLFFFILWSIQANTSHIRVACLWASNNCFLEEMVWLPDSWSPQRFIFHSLLHLHPSFKDSLAEVTSHDWPLHWGPLHNQCKQMSEDNFCSGVTFHIVRLLWSNKWSWRLYHILQKGTDNSIKKVICVSPHNLWAVRISTAYANPLNGYRHALLFCSV